MTERWLIDIDNPFVRDHCVLGQHILPGVAYIDLFFQMFRDRGLAWGSLELRNVSIYRPLIISKEKGVLLEVQSTEYENGHWRLTAEGRASLDGVAYGESNRYVTAELHHVGPVEFNEKIELAAAFESAGQTCGLEEVYAACRQTELVHGDFMQAEGRLYVAADAIHVAGRLKDVAEASAEHVLFHPTLIDASLTCGGGSLAAWHDEGYQRQLSLPLFYQSFRASELLQKDCVARIRRKSVRELQELTYYTVEFFNGTGRKIAELKEFASKLVRDPALINPGRTSSTTGTATGAWTRRSHPSAVPTIAATSGTVLDPHGRIEKFLQSLIAERLHQSPDHIDPTMGYFDLGIGSVDLLDLVQSIQAKLGGDLSPTLLFEHVTIKQLSAYLAEHYPEALSIQASEETPELQDVPESMEISKVVGSRSALRTAPEPSATSPVPTSEDIAIIGMAGRFPMARDIREYWQNLKAGRDCITEVPASRWDWRRFDALRSPSGKKLSRWGGFLQDEDCFDAQFFHVSAREAEITDPQERLFLETCWEAIEDSGYTPETLVAPYGPSARRLVGVFTGVMHKDYTLIANEAQNAGQSVITLQCNASIANRVSYYCGFHGPSMSIDTVCSSSLVAVHLALQSLRTGECEVALAGGVNLSLHPAKYVAYGMMDMHASDGRCRTFGAGGDGYVSSEAIAAIVLKPLSKAVADGDNIYATIKGSSTNHVGSVAGFTVPSPGAQTDLIASCMEKANVDPRSISYVEAHGTGTSLGDPIEMEGLIGAFRSSTEDVQFCAVGSVKSNIGHAESAAGLCGLIKVALQLHHRTLVASLHSHEVNPYIQWARSPFFVQKEMKSWERPVALKEGSVVSYPRRAALSSFGATGANAHVILEEYSGFERRNGAQPHLDFVVVPLSARSDERLRAYAGRILVFLKDPENGFSTAHEASSTREGVRVALARLAYTLQVGRKEFRARVAFVVDSVSNLVEKLTTFQQGEVEVYERQGNKQAYVGNGARALDEDLCCFELGQASRADLENVAQRWTSGQRIDWRKLYGDDRPQRMSLPTYPFARERYWIPRSNVPAPLAELSQATESLEPVVHASDGEPHAAAPLPEGRNPSGASDQPPEPPADPHPDTAALKEKTLLRLRTLLSDVTKFGVESIASDEPLETYGIDSVMILLLNDKLEKVFGNLSKTLFFEYPTLAGLGSYLVDEYREACVQWCGMQSRETATDKNVGRPRQRELPLNDLEFASVVKTPDPKSEREEIAIIGLSGRYPQSSNVHEFWKHLSGGEDCTAELSSERWSLDSFYESDVEKALASGKSYTKWGGMLEGFSEFDPLFFNISPRDAANIDPQERLFLQASWEVLEDAGYTRESLAKLHRGRVGVYAGVTKTGFDLYGPTLWQQGKRAYPHTSFASIANRVSYVLDLHGPSIPIDTMCSASLTAIHEACEHLLRDECEMAIAGGVNLYLHHSSYVSLCAARMLSSNGRCKSFGAGADGFVPGEGVGVVLLKPLRRAIEDGDHIYGVIKGSSINHGGKTNGYTVPNPIAQRELVEKALKIAKVDPRTISYIEAHGTGTSLGDPIEIAGLTQAFNRYTSDLQFCAIGSVKSNIGHLESAAGIAGLTKVLLQMRHQKLAPSLHAKDLNPHIDFERTPFRVQQELVDWERPIVIRDGVKKQFPRIAGVSSFGAGGANAHVIVEEYLEPESARGTMVEITPEHPALIVLSAKTEERLREQAKRLLIHIADLPLTENDLSRIAYTLQSGREAMDQRLAFSAASMKELQEKLAVYVEGKTSGPTIGEIYRGEVKKGDGGWSLLRDDDGMSALVGAWVEKGSHAKLLQLWTRGIELDWTKLYPRGTPRRISLPTYPFAKEKYWIGATEQQTARRDADEIPIGNEDTFSSRASKRETPRGGHAEREEAVLLARPTWAARELQSAPDKDAGDVERWVCIGPSYEKHLDELKERLPEVKWSIFPSLDRSQGPGADGIAAIYEFGFEKVRSLLQSKAKRRSLLQMVVPLDSKQSTMIGALTGLLGSAPLENPKFAGQMVLIPEHADAADLAKVIEENGSEAARGDREIRYVDGLREVKVFKEMKVERTDQLKSPWKDGGVYLITGGAGGLGLIFAAEVAQRVKGVKIVVSGRSKLSAKKLVQIDALRNGGTDAQIEYCILDVSDAAAVRKCVAGILDRYGKLNGIVHSAGVIRDSFLIRKRVEDFNSVLIPKVHGTINLDLATQDIDLDFLLLFSSLSGVFGNIGQGDYACANAFMDRFAGLRNELVERSQRRGRTVSIDWPLWESGGMTVDNVTLAMMRREGIYPLKTSDGLAALYRAWGSDQAQVIVLSGDRARLIRLFQLHADDSAVFRDGFEFPNQPEEPTPRRSSATNGKGPGVDKDSLLSNMKRELIGQIAKQLEMNTSAVSVEANFVEFGFDSLSLKVLSNELNRVYGWELGPTLFFEYPTVESLARYLVDEYPEDLNDRYLSRSPGALNGGHRHPEQIEPTSDASVITDQSPRSGDCYRRGPQLNDIELASERSEDSRPIAIIAMSGNFPGATDLDTLWQNLKAGKDNITEIPQSRWDYRKYYDPRKGTPGRSYSKWGGFIENTDHFDPLFFNIAPRNAESIDPQELLFLETVWDLLESGGHTREALAARYRGKIGVYVGSTYHHQGFPETEGLNAFGNFVNSHAAIANRVSHFFGLNGPSIAVDTMCSSAASAIHLACKDLRSGECSAAIAGGVSLSTHPYKYIGLSQAQIIGSSHSGSRSFAAGDGYHPAEAVGAVLLKPLSQAVLDGDTILAIIASSAMKHSGRENAYAVPNPNVQAELIEEVCRRAAIDANTISYVEAAANGSELGDAIEVVALSKAFEKFTDRKAFCAIGAVKGNIGHAEAASAISQLAKVVLQLKHGELVPTLAPGTLNPNLQLEKTPFYLIERCEPWHRPTIAENGSRQSSPRRALVNSFGAGGTYVSLLLEEYRGPEESLLDSAPSESGLGIVAVSARTSERLLVRLQQLRDYLVRNEDVSLSDLTYTLLLGREAMNVRWAIVVGSIREAIDGLEAYLASSQGSESAAASSPVFQRDIGEPSELRDLLSAPAKSSILETIVRESDPRQLVVLWTHGVPIPWGSIQGMQKRRLVPVPTYPFARIDVRRADRLVPVEGQRERPDDVVRYGKDERPSARPLRKALSTKFGIPGDEISGNSRLQDLGINSIEVINLRHELERELGCEIPLRTFERTHSISEIELKLQQLVATHRTTIPSEQDVPVLQPRPDLNPSAGPPAEFPSIVENRAERGKPFPLADIQEAFLVGRRLGGQDRVGAHLYFEFEIPKLDIHRMNAAWNRLVARHEMLRAVQLPDNQQQIRQDVPVYRIKAKDLRRHHEAERQRLMLELRQRLLTRVYDPAQWPLFDICVSICPQSFVLHFSIDEFIIDGAGIALLFEQWNRLYQTPDLDLTPLSLSFRDVVLAQKQFERSHRYRRDLEYWMSKLDGSLSGPRIPKRFYQNGTAEDRDRIRLSATLSPSEWSSLTRRAEKVGVSATVMLLTLFGEVLRVWSEQKSFALLMTYFNRLPWHEQINEVVAPFASTNIFVLGERRDRWLSELMRNHEQQAWTDIDHSSVSGVRVLRELKAQRKVPGSFSLPVVFTSLIASPGTKRESAGETDGLFQMRRFYENHTPQVYLDHQVTEHDGQLEISWDVSRKHFGDASIDLMFQGYCELLHRLSRSDTDWSVEDIEKVIEAAKSADPERFDGRNPGPVEEPASPHSPTRLDLVAETEGQFEPFPLTDQQQAYAFGRSKLLIGGGNSCQCYYEFNVQQLDVKRLEGAWRKVMEAHPMLCTEVRTTGTQIRLDPVPAYSVQVVDLRELTQAERAAALAETRSMMLRVFPLGEWPYFDLRVSLIDAHTASIHFSIDLLIADGTSIAVVIQDLLKCYSNPGKPARQAAITFRDYVMALQRYRATSAYQRDLSYWEKKFATLPSGPTFGLRERLVEVRGKRNRFNGRLMNWSRVKERAKQEGVSPSAVLLASFMEVLWEWNQRRPFSVVVPSWNRAPLHREIYRVVGDFTAMSWIASCDAPESSFSEKIRAYHKVMEEGLAHQAGSGLTALRKSAAKRGRKSLVFSAVFTDLVPKVDDEALPVGFEQVDAVSQTPQVHLDSMCHDSGDTLEFYWDIQSGVYPAGMIGTMFDGYRRILQYLSDHPNDWEGHLFSELIDASPGRYEGQEATEAEWIPRTENANGRSQPGGPKTELRVLS